MRVENEELFVIDYENNPNKRIIYLPLRSYLALTKEDIAEEIITKDNSPIKKAFFQKIKKRPLIDIFRSSF